MQGIELSRAYFEAYGRPLLDGEFSNVKHRIAVGLVGEGSECLGFDDDASRDHDFEPGFCLWIPDEDEKEYGFRLERAYAELPQEFMGVARQKLSPVGGPRHGVFTVGGFYRKFLGTPSVPDTVEAWLQTPSAMFRSAVNGEVFTDPLGRFSAVRDELLRGYPEDIRRKKLSAHLIFMTQAGQYNFARCAGRGDVGGAALCMYEFIRHTVSAVYLLNNVYEPFYKWTFRGMKSLPWLSELRETLVGLTDLGNTEKELAVKKEVIDAVCTSVAEEVRTQQLTEKAGNRMDELAYAVENTIEDPRIRTMHIMEGI